MMNNPRPMSLRKTVQLMVILTLLAWATQTLFRQWGYGAVILPQAGSALAPGEEAPNQPTAHAPISGQLIGGQASPDQLTGASLATALIHAQPAAAVLELRDRVDAKGELVTLRDVCRWSEQDAATLDPLGKLVLARWAPNEVSGTRKVTVHDVRLALHDAGANLPAIEISGAAACAVVRGVQGAAEPGPAMASEKSSATTRPADAVAEVSLKDLLTDDLLHRLGLAQEDVQIEFDPQSDSILALTGPRESFQVDFSHAQALGPVAWNIAISGDQGPRQVTVTAKASAWEDEWVLTRSLSRGQSVQKGDLAPQRVLVQALTPDKLAKAEQAIGQVTTRDLKRGDLLTTAALAAPPVVQAGDFVTVSLTIGSTEVQTVVRALDAGPTGGQIRATNEASGQVYLVRVTGPGAGQVTQVGESAQKKDQDVASIN